MFNQLTLDQISNAWGHLKGPILEAVGNGDYLNDAKLSEELLTRLLTEDMECWISYDIDDVNKKNTVAAVLLCFVSRSPLRMGTEYVVYSGTTLVPIAEGTRGAELVKEAFECLQKHASKMGCARIVTYTKSPRMINLFKEYGGDVLTRYLVLDVEE